MLQTEYLWFIRGVVCVSSRPACGSTYIYTKTLRECKSIKNISNHKRRTSFFNAWPEWPMWPECGRQERQAPDNRDAEQTPCSLIFDAKIHFLLIAHNKQSNLQISLFHFILILFDNNKVRAKLRIFSIIRKFYQ